MDGSACRSSRVLMWFDRRTYFMGPFRKLGVAACIDRVDILAKHNASYPVMSLGIYKYTIRIRPVCIILFTANAE